MEVSEAISRPQRSLSFSTISDATFSSSLVNRQVIDYENTAINANNSLSAENFIRSVNEPVQNNIRIESPSEVHVGDAIYNIYNPPSSNGN
jgi:hypothetical protein